MDWTQLLQQILARMPAGAQGPQGRPFIGGFPGQSGGFTPALPAGGGAFTPTLPSMAQPLGSPPIGTGFGGRPMGLAGLAPGGYQPNMMGGPYGNRQLFG